MKRTVIKYFIVLVMFFLSVSRCYSHNNITTTNYDYNITTEEILTPSDSSYIGILIRVKIVVRFKNTGYQSQSNVKLKVEIRSVRDTDTVVYRDSSIQDNWNSNERRDIEFALLKVRHSGPYKIIAICDSKDDHYRQDDTATSTALATYYTDVQIISISNPDSGAEKPQRVSFQPTVVLTMNGYFAFFWEINAHVEIRKVSGQSLFFQADTIVPRDLFNNLPVVFSFPSSQGDNDIADLDTGYYQITFIVWKPDESDTYNDTARQFFRIVPASFIGKGENRRYQTFSLSQNYPNPFSISTKISYSLAENGFVTIRIFDMVGNLVRTVVSGALAPGSYNVQVSSDGLTSGIYTYEMSFTNPQGKSQNVVRTMGVLK